MKTGKITRRRSEMIPKEKYLSTDQFTYITDEMFLAHHTQEEFDIFNEWMRGQTCSLVGKVVAIYSWDYERWLSQGKQERQGPDWD
jgi:hypothetical protein